eukprot:TRINITY_DN9677_c0_g1_i5.p1 TRINITY_DN9677_c0_g1~~TRINITY_DN9677_c0_g1_i5.p1  ORF type:complete len:157 (+),score=20.27 TRINITY_DN9677_c0_g1_i5:95-565(+)
MGGGLNVSPTRSDSLVSVLVHSQLFKSTVGLEVRCGVEKKFSHKDDQKRSLIVILLKIWTEVREGRDALSFRSETFPIFVISSLHSESTVFQRLKNAITRELLARDKEIKIIFSENVGQEEIKVYEDFYGEFYDEIIEKFGEKSYGVLYDELMYEK